MLDAAPQMIVNKDDARTLDLIAGYADPRKPGSPMWFGAVRIGKAYVSYHLMPIYTEPALAAAVPDGLKKRMQGKSCFNFKTLDETQRADLQALTRQCAAAYGARG